MDRKNYKLKIKGGNKLKGVVFVQGSKNAILPMIAAALIPKKGYTVIRNVPPLNDILIAFDIARSVGAEIQYFEKEQTVAINASNLSQVELPVELTGLLRASVLFIPPVLLRMGKVKLPSVGGCPLGERKLDFHYRGFVRLGASINDKDDFEISAKDLKGNNLYLDFPSHTGTENLIMAACLSKGETIIENAASDPEIVDFGNFLIKMGAQIKGIGTRTIYIKGVEELKPVDYVAMPDRLDSGFFIIAAGITKSNITLIRSELNHLRLLREKLYQMGIKLVQEGSLVHVIASEKLEPINIVTCPYPGFATDFQPGIMAISCLANGKSYIRERIFEDRFNQAYELNKMGAKIDVIDSSLAIVNGPVKFMGTSVTSHDIRAGVSLILAAIAAEGETIIDNVYQIDRGHYAVETRLGQLGADIERIPI
ncbi:MAG: UDP-N-acetylglucosamine 1-carboxyvinyltransferase [Desulfobacterales bacterium]|nr:UDP-N-acetylglucosamine 1-carboxyvinyltransferase [Desulfobacterales bacterium]